MTKTKLCKCGHEEDLHHYGKWCQKIIGWDEDKQSTIMGIKGERGENIDCPCKKFEPQSQDVVSSQNRGTAGRSKITPDTQTPTNTTGGEIK